MVFLKSEWRKRQTVNFVSTWGILWPYSQICARVLKGIKRKSIAKFRVAGKHTQLLILVPEILMRLCARLITQDQVRRVESIFLQGFYCGSWVVLKSHKCGTWLYVKTCKIVDDSLQDFGWDFQKPITWVKTSQHQITGS